jgi:hypothetical protein
VVRGGPIVEHVELKQEQVAVLPEYKVSLLTTTEYFIRTKKYQF